MMFLMIARNRIHPVQNADMRGTTGERNPPMNTETSNSHRPRATSEAIESKALDLVEVDMYRDIHKGIRAELFAVTTAAGNIDPEIGTRSRRTANASARWCSSSSRTPSTRTPSCSRSSRRTPPLSPS